MEAVHSSREKKKKSMIGTIVVGGIALAHSIGSTMELGFSTICTIGGYSSAYSSN